MTPNRSLNTPTLLRLIDQVLQKDKSLKKLDIMSFKARLKFQTVLRLAISRSSAYSDACKLLYLYTLANNTAHEKSIPLH